MRRIKWDYESGIATEYKRSGECNNCGECCQEIIDLHGKGIGCDSRNGNRAVYKNGVWGEENNGDRVFMQLSMRGERGQCSNLVLGSGGCTSHGKKAFVCASFPIIPDHIKGLPSCSYKFTELASWQF